MADDMDHSIARRLNEPYRFPAERPKVPFQTDLSPNPIVRAHLDFDKAFGDLPKRFLRAARVLADRHDCREEWDQVERTHDALDGEDTITAGS